MGPLTQPFEDLAQALRVLWEANYRAEVEGLIRVDRAEAARNVENAVSGVLHSFHSLVDAMAKAGMQRELGWYQTPELALMHGCDGEHYAEPALERFGRCAGSSVVCP